MIHAMPLHGRALQILIVSWANTPIFPGESCSQNKWLLFIRHCKLTTDLAKHISRWVFPLCSTNGIGKTQKRNFSLDWNLALTMQQAIIGMPNGYCLKGRQKKPSVRYHLQCRLTHRAREY